MRGHHPRELVAIFLGGALGAVLRAVLGELVVHEPLGWPWPTFTANLLAAFLLGWVGTILMDRHRRGAFAGPFWAAGLCGGLSTFSTVQVEVVELLRGGAVTLALGYVLATVLGGLAVVHAGTVLARRHLHADVLAAEAAAASADADPDAHPDGEPDVRPVP